MRGLNSMEQLKTLHRRLFSAAFYSFIIVLRPFLHTRESVWLFAVAAALTLLWVLWSSIRRRQRAGAILLLVSCLATALPFLHLSPATSRLLACVSAALWGTGVAVLVWDWFLWPPRLHAAGPASPLAKTIPVLTGADRAHHEADDARASVLERLRLQAIAAGSPLTEGELQFVDYSRIQSDETAKEVEERLYQDHDYWKFKDQVIEMFADAVRTDRVRDPQARRKYKRLIRELTKGRKDLQLVTFLRSGFYQARTSKEFAVDAASLALIGTALLILLITAFLWATTR